MNAQLKQHDIVVETTGMAAAFDDEDQDE